MFSYYGSKNKIAKLYPKPLYNTIIEPFCGAAWYSILYKDKKIILNDINKIISGIWEFLINDANPEILLYYKDLFLNDDIRNLKIDERHRDLLGFLINRGCSAPGNIVQKWICQVAKKTSWASTTAYNIQKIADSLNDIKHWEIFTKDYTELPNIEATWFIDPPYKIGGQYYKYNNIDYKKLGKWCKSRRGQVIVCENNNADWLDFKPLIEITGQKKKSTEFYWTNINL